MRAVGRARLAAWVGALLLAAAPAGAEAPRLRVLVGLDVATLPEAWLPEPGQAKRQRDAIRLSQLVLALRLLGQDVRVTHAYESLPYLGLDVALDALPALAASPEVTEITGDELLAPALGESVPLVEADRTRGAGDDGAGQVVAVVDSGVDAAHPFLAGRVVEEACFSGSGSCPDGRTVQIGPGAAAPCDYDLKNCRHGTHVAGIVAGSASGLSGIAPGAQLIAIQVFSQQACGSGTCALAHASDVVRALEHVYALRATYPIAAVNLSLGGREFAQQRRCARSQPALRAALDNLRAAGIAAVVAAGNSGAEGKLAMPACMPGAVSVSATDKSNTVSFFSNSAGFLDLLAPGRSITSSVPDGRFDIMNGTSMAAPHVAGAWAVMKQRHPEARVGQVLARLKRTGSRVRGRRGKRTRLIQLAAATHEWPPPTVSLESPRGRATVAPGDVLTIGWSQTHHIQRVSIYVSERGRRAWRLVAADLLGRSYDWPVPDPVRRRSRARILLVGFDAAGQEIARDESDRPVRIKRPRTRRGGS